MRLKRTVCSFCVSRNFRRLRRRIPNRNLHETPNRRRLRLGLNPAFQIGPFALTPPEGAIELGKKIQHSSTSVIYEGTYFGSPVAIKRFNEGRSLFGSVENISQADLQSLKKEARLLRSLQHPNVVCFYGFTLNPPQIVMEYWPNGSLCDVIHNHPEKLQSPKTKSESFKELWRE